LRRVGKKPKQAPETMLDQHIRSIGFSTREQYETWCRALGFPIVLQKHRKQLAREIAVANSLRQNSLRHAQEPRARDALGWVLDACNGEDPANIRVAHIEYVAKRLKQADASCSAERPSAQVLLDIVQHVSKQNAKLFFEPVLASPRFAQSHDNTFLAGLMLLSAYQSRWIRPIQDWKPCSYNPRRQFSSLIHHLFDRHKEMPECMISAWFSGMQKEAISLREWCVQVGSGAGLKGCRLPIPYTRKLSKSFSSSPADLTIPEALRWAQVLSLGGSKRLADAMVATRLGSDFSHDDFWNTVLSWFIDHPMLDPVHIGPVIDYLHQERFVNVEGANGENVQGPRQPNLSMKGRSPESLLEQVTRWHRELAKTSAQKIRTWNMTNIQPLRLTEGTVGEPNFKIWTIRELVTQQSLVNEGRKLKHCVASYASSCAKGHSSIWSMELEQSSVVEKRVTIEVNPGTRQVVQIRGKLNRHPNQQELNIIRRWATAAKLVLRT